MVVGSDIICQCLENASSISDENAWKRKDEYGELWTNGEKGLTGYRVEFAYFVHVGKGNDEFILDGHAAANEAGVAALGDDGYLAVVAPLEDAADLLGCFRFEDGSGGAVEAAHPIGVMGLEFMRRGGDGRERRKDGGWGEKLGKVSNV